MKKISGTWEVHYLPLAPIAAIEAYTAIRKVYDLQPLCTVQEQLALVNWEGGVNPTGTNPTSLAKDSSKITPGAQM